VDIIILPGMARFAQSLRSFFLRRVHRRANLLAHALTVACLLPLVIVFLASWVARWLGLGSGRGMLRVTNAIPLTVAGHARFAARKPSQSSPCTSAS
jgi:hypothetical protein